MHILGASRLRLGVMNYNVELKRSIMVVWKIITSDGISISVDLKTEMFWEDSKGSC